MDDERSLGLRSTLEAHGAFEVGGTTGRDRTRYAATVPTSSSTGIALSLIDWLQTVPGRANRELVAKASASVRDEIRRKSSDPTVRMRLLIAAVSALPDSPLAAFPLGSIEDVERITVDDVRQWLARFYTSRNLIISFAGPVELPSLREGFRRAGLDAREAQLRAPRALETIAVVPSDRSFLAFSSAESRLYVTWNTPGSAGGSCDELDLVRHIFNERLTARLSPTAVSVVQGTFDCFVDFGQFRLTVAPAPAVRADELLRAIDGVWSDLARGGTTQTELRSAKHRLIDSLMMDVADPAASSARADIAAQGALTSGDPWSYLETIKRYEDTSLSSIRNLAATWFAGKGSVIQQR